MAGLLIGSVVALNYPGLIESPVLAPLLDPFGGEAIQERTRYWTEAERNTRLLGLTGALAWNRAFALAMAGAVLGALVRVYRFAHVTGGGRRRGKRRVVASPATAERSGPVAVPRVAGSFGARTAVRQTLAITRDSLREAATRWSWRSSSSRSVGSSMAGVGGRTAGLSSSPRFAMMCLRMESPIPAEFSYRMSGSH